MSTNLGITGTGELHDDLLVSGTSKTALLAVPIGDQALKLDWILYWLIFPTILRLH